MQKTWLGTAKSSSVWHTGLSGGAPDSVRCARLNSGEQAALGKCLATYDYNSPDCPVSRLRRSRRSRESFNGVRLKFTGRSGEAPDYPVSQRSTEPTVGRAIHA